MERDEGEGKEGKGKREGNYGIYMLTGVIMFGSVRTVQSSSV